MASMQDDTQSNLTLPEDSVFEILTWVSLQALPACRRVCRQWHRLTYEPSFTSLHCNRTQTISGYFIQSLRRNHYYSSFVSIQPLPSYVRPLSLDFLPKDVKIEAVACRGIVLCTSQDYRGIPRYYVCKPATRQWWWIPNPKTRYLTERIAIVACSTGALKYKIIRFSRPKQKLDYLRCEIFDSQSQVWRRSTDIQLPPVSLRHEAPVSVNGVLYWLTYHGKIFAFDIYKETCKLILLPQEEVGEDEIRWDCRKLVKREGQLCLIRAEKQWMEILVMANYKEQRWEKRKVVSLEAIKENPVLTIRDLYLSDIVFIVNFYNIMWYDFWRGMLANININHLFPQEVFRFESDLMLAE